MERNRPTEDEDRPSTSTAENDSARPRCTEDPSPEQVDHQDSDQDDSDGDVWKDLHQAIQKGDIEYVRRVLQSDSGGEHFSYEGTTALYLAFSREQYDIASFLIHRGAKVHSSEFYDLYDLEIDLKRLNYLLLDYNRKSEKSCIYQLTSWSQCPQGLEGDRLRAVMRLYEEFYESPILRLLMKVLEKEPFDIVYDFESELVDRTHRLYPVESEIYGLTLSNSREIFIGAKTLLCGDSRKRAKVYGVVAEEMCHLALTILFQNDAKPYREEDSKLMREFQEIVSAVRSSFSRACHVEKVIKDVYENYEYPAWECELIARVPHVVGLHGEELGRIVMESPELSRLFEFYTLNVHPKCEEYTQPSLNTKAHRLMEQALRKNDYISFQQKQVQPLKEGFTSFTEFLVDVEGISVIATNCEKLCTLQIYHELKREHGDALEKKCLFLTRKSFERKRERILDALKGRVWEYLILVLDEKDLNLRRLTREYVDEFEEFKGEAMQIVIISPSESLGPKFEKKTAKYKWNDLSEDFKTLQSPVEYRLNGERESEYIAKEYFLKLFSEEEILRIISGTVIEICDGKRLYSQGYTHETYICREFQMMTVDLQFFKHLPSNSSVFLSNFRKSDFRYLSIDDKLVQWFSGSDDRILKDKSIFIDSIERPMSFEEFVRRNHGKSNIWVHHDKQAFYLRNNDISSDAFKTYVKKITMNEQEMLEYLKRSKTVIISDNAGCGKSTVVSSLIRSAKENLHGSWVWRINVNEFCMGKKDHRGKENALSLANINHASDEEDVLDYFYLILGLRNGFEEHIFHQHSRYGLCYIFFDGFDEIPSEYTDSALKLLSVLRKKTAANIIITTRKHHQDYLEEHLNTRSHQLVSFSQKDQVTYLVKFWKNKLKYPKGEGNSIPKKDQKAVGERIKEIIEESRRKEAVLDPEFQNIILALQKIDCEEDIDSVRLQIDKLDFTRFATVLLDKAALDDRILEFMGIPLHLFMIGNILYNANFNIELECDIFDLYSQFVEQKISIYIEEKEGIQKESTLKHEIVTLKRENAFRIHMELAFQFMGKGEVCLASERKKIELELCSSLGIVFIQNERIQFLHQTFAEFFVAEYTLKMLKKEFLLKIVSQPRYNVVRRFLSSALKKKNFENLSKEFCEDTNFLVKLMESIFHYFSDYTVYESNRDMFCCFKIVRKILETFEALDVNKNFVKKFIHKIDVIVSKKEVSVDDMFLIPHSLPPSLVEIRPTFAVGCCFTVNMLKILLTKDFKTHSMCIVPFVRISESKEEVIDLLMEYISMKTTGRWWSFDPLKRLFGVRDKKNTAADRILDLLKLTDANKFDFIISVLCNERAEIFAHVCKFFRDVLGKDRFMKEFCDSEEIRKQLESFLLKADPDKIYSTFEAFNSVFGDETENIFQKDFKLWTIVSTGQGDGSDRSKVSFEDLIISLGKHMGNEKLKEYLLSKYVFGDYLKYLGTDSFSSSVFLRCFQVVEETLGDREKVKLFLKSTDRNSANIFQLAVQRNLYLNVLFQFYKDRMEMDEIRVMISDFDRCGRNLMHYVLACNSSEAMKKNMAEIKGMLSDDELFVQLIKGRDGKMMTIFHYAAANESDVDLSYLSEYLSDAEIRDMLMEGEKDGRTLLHEAANFNQKYLPFLLEYVYKILKTDRNRLDDLILMRTNWGNTFLHELDILRSYGRHVNALDLVKRILDRLRKILSPEIFRIFLNMRNMIGKSFLQTKKRREFEIRTFCKQVLEAELLEEILETRFNWFEPASDQLLNYYLIFSFSLVFLLIIFFGIIFFFEDLL